MPKTMPPRSSKCSHCTLYYFGIDVEPFLFLRYASHGLVLFSLPQLLQSTICHKYYNATICNSLHAKKHEKFQNDVQETAAKWMTILPMSTLALSAIVVLFVGPFSDIIGKRRTMLICPILTMIQGIIFMTLSLLPRGIHPAWFALAVCVPGFFGDVQGAIVAAIAYRADTTTVEQRTKGVSRAVGILVVAVSVSIFCGGLLMRYVGFWALYCLFLPFSLMNMLYVAFVLPDESTIHLTEEASEATMHQEGSQQTMVLKDNNVSGDFKSKANTICSALCHLHHYRRLIMSKEERKNIIALSFLFSLAVISYMGHEYVGSLYLSRLPIGKSKLSFVAIISLIYFSQGIGAIFLVPLLQRVFHFGDFHLIILGYLSLSIFYTIIGFAVKAWMQYLSLIPMLCAVLPVAVYKSMLTKHVDNDLHGTILGIVESVDAISSGISSFVSNAIYHKTLAIHQGIVAFFLAGVTLIGLVLTLLLMHMEKRKRKENRSLNLEETKLLLEDKVD